MLENRIALSFYHFDGEGGGAEGATASAEAKGQKQEDVKPSEVQYGKSQNATSPTSHVGNDTADEGVSLSDEFASLVGKGGRFHDQYGQAVSQAIQDRFKNQENLQAQVDSITDGLSPLFLSYGLESGDYEGLTEAIANDDSFYERQAERAGLSVSQYKENLKLKADAERGRQIQENFEERRRREEMFSQWEADQEVLRESFPSFDLGLEIENNEEFRDLLDAGVSVRNAFFATHIDEITQGYNAHAESRATANVVNAMQQKARRPVESGVNHSAAVVRKSDPRSLTGEDLDEINRRVEQGDTVAF